MALERVEIITFSERCRGCGDGEKVHLVERAFAPGVKVAEFARQRGVDPGLLYRWRRQMSGHVPGQATFTPLTVFDGGDAAAATVTAPVGSGTVEVEFASGVRRRVSGAADRGSISSVISALRDRRR